MNTKVTRRKRFLSGLLTLAMLLTMTPLSAFAAEDYVAEVTVGNTTTPYGDLASAFSAVQYASGSVTVKLLSNVDNFYTGFNRSDGVQLNSGDVTFDLNGHYLERYNNGAGTNANKKAVFYVTGSAKLTVMDSVGGGEILQPLSEPALIVDSSASLTVLSGTITNTGAGCGVRIDGGTLAVEGGTINASFDAGICVGGGTVTVTGTPEIYGGKASALLINGESTVTLSGGTYTTDETDKRSILTTVGKVTDLLADGFRFTDANGLDVAITEDGQGTESDRVTVSDFGIKYIGADGAEQKCTSFTELTDASTGDLTGWYAVTGAVDIGGAVGVTGDNTLNLILCDGAQLNLTRTLYMLRGSTLNIYGQSGGTGTLIIESSICQPAIGIMVGSPDGTVTVNIYGGTVTAKTAEGAQPIGSVPAVTTSKANVTIAKGLKCVKTDDLNTAYAYDNTDGTSITITKCIDHKWSYANITDDAHDQTCDLCGTTETGVAHTAASYRNIPVDPQYHYLVCACGKEYGKEYHTYTYAPNSDGLTHTATCKCAYAVDDIEHTYKDEDKACICDAVHSATYDGKKYASLQSAIDAAAPVGGTVTLARQVNENVVVTDGTVTIDLGGNRWSGDIEDGSFVPLTVNGGSVTLKNGNLFQWWSGSSALTGIVINGGSVTVGEDARVMGGVPDRNTKCPSITLNGGTLVLKEGAVLLSGLQVPEGKVLANYLPEGTAFVKCSYDYDSGTVTVSDPQEFVSDIYTANKITEGMIVVSHTHDFGGGTACPCGFNCEHSVVDEATGKCMICDAQIYIATVITADGSRAHFDSFADAWEAAVDNEGSTLKLLCDVDLGQLGTNTAISVKSGAFTLDLNDFTLSAAYSSGGVINVSGSAKLTVKNGKLVNTATKGFAASSTAITLYYGTVELENVELTGGSEYGEQVYSAAVNAGTLRIMDSTFNGALRAYPDALAKIELKIASATLNNGIEYTYDDNSNRDYDGLKGFFADGCMLFDKNGKYIDLTSDDYWSVGKSSTTFKYTDKAIVKSHEHTFVDGKCAECGYACPHDSGKNDREAGYFEKAICSVCHCEYGDFAPDTTAPTGKIKIKERNWWQTVLNAISFGLFYNEDASMIITATDDSYSQPGFDETKHAVKIECFVSDGILSEEAVENSTEFREYTKSIDFSTEQPYVVYVRLTDHAGNVTYAGSVGFEIDKTAPRIEEGMENGGVYSFCGEKAITVTDKNIDKITMDGAEITLDKNGQYTLPVDSEKHKIIAADKAGNETTVWITVYPAHDFDKTTDTCLNCGTLAAAKVEKGEISDRFATGDELFKALEDAKYNGAVVTLLTDVTITKNVSASGEAHIKNDLTIDLNGKTLQGAENKYIMVAGGAVRIYSSNGEGTLATDLSVYGTDASLTMDSGIGEVGRILFRLGNLTIRSGRYGVLNIVYEEGDVADIITLYGGSYDSIYLASAGSATAEQLLGKGCRYDGVSYATAQAKKQLSNVSVIPCNHADLSDFVCVGCGMEIFLSVEANGETKLFGTFEDAIRYAEQNDGCTVKLLQDITLCRENVGSLISNYYIYLKTGTYMLDLAGKALTIGDGAESLQGLSVTGGCNLTVTDTVGGGKIKSSRWGEVFEVRSDGLLTIESGDCTELSRVLAWGSDSLTIKDGKFNCVASKESSDSVSPLTYLADGCAFMLGSGEYANESNVESQYISGRGTMYWINGVTVVPAPLVFRGQPTDVIFYLTSPDAKKCVDYLVSYVGDDTDKKVTLTPEKADGSKIATVEVPAAYEIAASFDMAAFGVEHSGQYRIRAEFSGYVLYSNTFTVTVAECEHPGYDRDNKCTQCRCDLAAAIVKDGKTTGYVNFADALAAAQTDANKGCVLWLLADVTDRVTVSGGDFKFSINGYSIGGLGVTKTAKLNIFSGTINGTVAVAKTANLIASVTNFMGAVNDLGNMSSFINCVFVKSLNAKGSNTNLNNCTINDALNVSGNKVTLTASTVYGKTTVNNGGLLRFMGNGGKYGETLVKSGGGLEVYSNNTLSGTITAESGSKLTLSGGVYTKIAAVSGAKLTISGGSYAEVGAENNVDFTLSGGEFTNITVNGQHLIDCLAEGKAFEDMNNGFIIDGRVGIAGDVKVVDHTHTCVWKTDTHEKLCGCGYVAATDTDAPVISGVENGKTYYGAVEFSVTDANEFTVMVDGNPVRLTLGSYILEPDNKQHTITATDAAGNTASVTIHVFILYKVKLSSGEGYKITGEPLAGYGTDYTFTVEIAEGYSKTADFMVEVNGRPMQSDTGSYTVSTVTSDIVVTVFGVADTTPPEAEIAIGTNSFKSFINTITFGLFFKETQTVTVKTSDAGSGVSRVEYLLSETAFENTTAITGDWTALTLDGGVASFAIQPNQKGSVYVRVTDNSSNVQIINSDGVVVYTDAEAITGTVGFTMRDKNDVNFEVQLNGNTVAALYNGTEPIDSAQYTVSENGTITLKNSYLAALAAGEYTLRVAYNPMGEVYQSGDAPAMTSLKLTVEKTTASMGFLPAKFQKEYDGQPIQTPAYTANSDGAHTIEYKPAGAEDTAYSTEVPTNAGKYTLRVSIAETDTYKAISIQHDYEILKRSVTINNVTVEASKIYDGSADANITSAGTLSDNYDGDNLAIVTGKAHYSDRNVGTGKAVTFTEFALTGSAAANYALAAQPTGTTADITQRTLTIDNLKVKNKLYDGTNTAEIDGTPTLVGVVDGDTVQLLNGVPTFDSVAVGEKIAIHFTAFALFGDSTLIGNYALTQPSGITADIQAYIATGEEYTVNTNDWQNTDFVVTAQEGYRLSLTNTADGEWSDKLTASEPANDGTLTFYVKNSDGAITEAVAEGYKIDKTLPTGEIRIDERNGWQSFLNTISFGLFFPDPQTVTITAADNSDEDVAIAYLLTDKDLTIEQLADQEFTDYDAAFGIHPDGAFVVYARLTDKAGNVTWLRSDGMVLDATKPAISGVENGKTYCAAQTVTVTEVHLKTITVNDKEVVLDDKNQLVLSPAVGTQTIVVTDQAGNTATLTVTINDGHTGGEATCTAKAECTVCGEAYGELNPQNHTGEKRWTQTETTHTQAYTCCGAVTVEEENHEWKDGKCTECDYTCQHTGGEATCTAKAECAVCGEAYGELNPQNHTGEKQWTQTEKTHTQAYTCCGAVTVEEEAHEWKDGKCTECDYTCQHTGGEATCTAKAECAVCGEAYGELNPQNHADMKHTDAKAATEEAEGNVEYWHCGDCDQYFADEAGTQTMAEKDTVIAKLEPTEPEPTDPTAPADPPQPDDQPDTPTNPTTEESSQPQTGERQNLSLLFALLFVSGGLLTGAMVGKKKQESEE